MAVIYGKTNFEGAGKELTLGMHQDQIQRSMVVEKGEVVEFFFEDSEKGNKSLLFHEGCYKDLQDQNVGCGATPGFTKRTEVRKAVPTTTIYNQTYCKGEAKELDVTQYRRQHVRSMVVPPGQVVQFFYTDDKSGGRSLLFYEGRYDDLHKYDVGKVPSDPGLVAIAEVREATVQPNQIATFGWNMGGYPFFFKLSTQDALVDIMKYWHPANDKIEWIQLPEGLQVKVFSGGVSPTKVASTPGLEFYGPHHVNLKQFSGYFHTISNISVGGVEYKLLSTIVHSEDADMETYKTYGNKVEMENDTPMDEAVVTQGIGYEKSLSQSESWEAGFSITQTNTIKLGTDAMFVNAEFGLELSVNASFGGETSKEETESATLEVSASPGAFAACTAQAVLEMKKGSAPITRRFVNMKTGAEVEEKSILDFDAFADATANFSNYVELNTPEAIAWRKEQEEKAKKLADFKAVTF